MNKQRLVVAISGSSGAVLGIRLLQALRAARVETHLIITPAARMTIEQETHWKVAEVQDLADAVYNPRDMAASIASGSFPTAGMVVIPCSIKSLSSIANSYAGDLLTRAADVTLKEGRPLLLVVRETPLHAGHIRLMELAAQSGAIIFPPVPAFYAHPQTVDEIVDNLVGRVLSRLGFENNLYMHWQGIEPAANQHTEKENSPAVSGIDEIWALPSMTLSTCDREGQPHAATVYFAADEQRENLYFFSSAGSQHSLNLSGDSRAAAAIQPHVSGWQEIRGLQLRGVVNEVPAGEAWERGWVHYQKKFSFAGEIKEIIEKNTFYTFRPNWLRWVDNRLGFGHKEEWTRP